MGVAALILIVDELGAEPPIIIWDKTELLIGIIDESGAREISFADWLRLVVPACGRKPTQ